MSNYRVGEPEPMVCRLLHWHRWERVVTGAQICRRPGCLAVRPKASGAGMPDKLPGEDYWVVVTSPRGDELYSGPVPVPDGIDARAPEDVRAGRFNRYEVTLVEFDHPADA